MKTFFVVSTNWTRLERNHVPLRRFYVQSSARSSRRSITRSAQANLEFWSRICHYRAGGSGPSYLSGWATAFYVWGKKGNWQGPKLETFASPISEEERLESERYYVSDGLGFSFSAPPALFFGDVRYPVVEFSKIPNGYCEVDVRIDEFGTEYECVMVAGHVGFVVSGERRDILQPSPQWFLFEKEESSR